MGENKGLSKSLTVWDYFSRGLVLVSVVGVIWGAFEVSIGFGEWKESEKNKEIQLEKRIFDNESDKTKSDEHMNSDYTPVKSYQKQLKLDSVYGFALEQFKAGNIRDSLNKIKDVAKDSSRLKRSKDIEEMKGTQKQMLEIFKKIYRQQLKSDSLNN